MNRPSATAPVVGSASANPTTIADVTDLRVDFERDGKRLSALRGVDMSIRTSEIVGLVGESGSGKTVLGLALLGLLPDQAQVEGSVVVDGVDMLRSSEPERRLLRRRSLGAVFQDPMTSLDPTMRIGRQVHESAGTTKEAVRLLGAVGIPEPASRLRDYPHQLSGGLRQRVMLAIALAGGPRLIIADEPTTALDVTLQAQVLDQFRRMRDEFGCAILLVTHDLAVASTVADRLCVLYGGLISETGDIRAVLRHPAHPYTAALMRSRIDLGADCGAQLPVIGGEPIDPASHPCGCNFAPRCPAADHRCMTEQPDLRRVEAHDGRAACHYEAGERVARKLSSAVARWESTDNDQRGGVLIERVSVAFAVKRRGGRHESFHALSDVDLTVAPGESVALVGESGSGKTTLLRVIAGLQPPTSGGITHPDAWSPQMVFQDAGSSFTPWLTIGQHLEERILSLPRGERPRRVAEALTRLGLPASVAGVRARRLSGGQRQRAAIARAIIDPPSMLLCDEPTSALDASLAAGVLNLLGQLRRELGFSMVFVTHDLAVARLVADRIVVMNTGRIVEEGGAEQVVDRPTGDYTKALLASVPEMSA